MQHQYKSLISKLESNPLVSVLIRDIVESGKTCAAELTKSERQSIDNACIRAVDNITLANDALLQYIEDTSICESIIRMMKSEHEHGRKYEAANIEIEAQKFMSNYFEDLIDTLIDNDISNFNYETRRHNFTVNEAEVDQFHAIKRSIRS